MTFRFSLKWRQDELVARNNRLSREQGRFCAMSNEELQERAEYYLSQCAGPLQHLKGKPVYDSVMWHVIIPELLRRLK